MTRFALIPLALFANACASAEDAQNAVTDATEDVRAAYDEVEAQLDRSNPTYSNRIIRVAERMFRSEMAAEGCTFVAATAGGWRNRSFRATLNIIDNTGHQPMRLQGKLTWDSNDSGQLLAKGHNAYDNQLAALEADWLQNEIDGDLHFSGAETSYRYFGKKRDRGLGGLIIGAVADCKK